MHSSSKLKGGGSCTALDPDRQGAGAGDPREILVGTRRWRQPLAFFIGGASAKNKRSLSARGRLLANPQEGRKSSGTCLWRSSLARATQEDLRW
jgi:hypothetical protein